VKRGSEQCGTLGSGNHFLEVQVVDAVFDAEVAATFGLELNQVCVMIHSGSRGLGYQVCDDALSAFRTAQQSMGSNFQIGSLPALQPTRLKDGSTSRPCVRRRIMAFAIVIAHAANARSIAGVFGRSWQDLGMELLYDVAHNIAKLEEHTVDGGRKKFGSTERSNASFSSGHPEVPEQFRAVGQTGHYPGDMGRASWVLVGSAGSMEKTFGSTCHGAGRAMSRTAAKLDGAARKIDKELEARGVIAMAAEPQRSGGGAAKGLQERR